MALWTDIIDPATLTGYTRAALADYEIRKGSLNRWLPNRYVADTVARFVTGQTGLVDIAKWRAYDAAPEVGKAPSGKRVTLELPAIGQNIPVTEYNQIRARNANVSDEMALGTIQKAARQVARAISDAMELQRGIALVTGKNTIAQANFAVEDDFGRSAGNTVALSGTARWDQSSPTRLANLNTWTDAYVAATGEQPGAMVMSTRVYRNLAAEPALATTLVGGATRPATRQQVDDYLADAGLAPLFVYDRRVQVDGVVQRVVPDDKVLLLPAPVDPEDEEGTDLGATFWGQTLTATSADWGIAQEEQPGVVVGVFRGTKPPMIAEVISDAIGEPVLANADLSFAATVF